MSKAMERQRLIRLFKEETGQTEIDMHDVARFAVRLGYPLPTPPDAIDLLAKTFSEAARQEIRHDKKTGRPYRANHAVPAHTANGQTVFYWIDIDDPETKPSNMLKSAVMRREQMVDDGVQLSLDLDRWNSIRPEADHIQLPFDLTPDIDWRRNTLDDRDQAA